MRNLLVGVIFMVTAVAGSAAPASAVQLCYNVAHYYSIGRLWGSQDCFEDNWLLGDLLDWTAYL